MNQATLLYSLTMRRSAAAIFVSVMLLWVTAPLLACVLPGQSMTAQEHACCQRMAQMCGSSTMPQSHSCCKAEPASGNAMAAAVDHKPVLVLRAVAAICGPATPHTSEVLYEVGHHRPPKEFLPDSTVLRI